MAHLGVIQGAHQPAGLQLHGIGGEVDKQANRQSGGDHPSIAGQKCAEAGIIEIITDDEEGQEY
ncbi:hypothetical protein D3C71_2249300 [compost metagenome]